MMGEVLGGSVRRHDAACSGEACTVFMVCYGTACGVHLVLMSVFLHFLFSFLIQASLSFFYDILLVTQLTR